MANYFPDINRFSLAGPPKWWLSQLHTFDPTLAVVPSRQGFYYRLAQRKKLNLADRFTNDMLWNESDTKMLASYGLVPVTTILATANWSNPFLFEELRRRSVHRMGGAEKVTQMLEAQEAETEAKKQAGIDARLTSDAKDAWGLYKKKIGIQSHMWIPRTKTSAQEPKMGSAPALRLVKSS